MAARAAALFQTSQTQLILWQKEAESAAQASYMAEIRVEVIKIMQQPRTVEYAGYPRPFSPAIALCVVNGSPLFKPKELYRFVFSFLPSPFPTAGNRYHPSKLGEGVFIRVFEPWYQVTDGSVPDEGSTIASLPMPASLDTDPMHFKVNNSVIMCSRFMII